MLPGFNPGWAGEGVNRREGDQTLRAEGGGQAKPVRTGPRRPIVPRGKKALKASESRDSDQRRSCKTLKGGETRREAGRRICITDLPVADLGRPHGRAQAQRRSGIAQPIERDTSSVESTLNE